jgi:hypothetical protein
MNTRHHFFSRAILTIGILIFQGPQLLQGAESRLGVPVILPNRAVELTLSGQAEAPYSVEASMDFSNWFSVWTGIATNGVQSIRHDGATNYPKLFYRGKGTNDAVPPLTVGLKTDSNYKVSMLANLEGGSTVLYGPDGTRFTLTLPTNSIADSGILRMTLVTNIAGLPFARGTLGAVLLEPADLTFWGAASLEITFPANTDRREVLSFFCHEDGSAFQLTPDRVGTNRVVIPLTRMGVFGSSLATAQELAGASRIATASARPFRAFFTDKISALSAGSTSECFPAKQSAADDAKKEIDAASDAKSKEIAALLAGEREKELQGDFDDSAAVREKVAEELCTFYTSEIAPRWADATKNSALGKVLIVNTLGLERQRELLAATDNCTSMANIPFCEIFESNLRDISDCCARGMKGSAKVTEVLGILRQEQLLGLNCISPEEAQQVIDLCTSNAWTGTFTMTSIGGTNTSANQAGTEVITINEYKADFDGYVDESVEAGSPPAAVFLTIVGPLNLLNHYKKTSTRGPTPCSSGRSLSSISLSQTDTLIATNSIYKVSVSILQDQTYTMSVINSEESSPANPLGDPLGTRQTINYSRQTSCDGTDITNNNTQTARSSESGKGFNLTFADRLSMSDPNVITGSYSITDNLTYGYPVRYEFKWNFTRREEAP